MTFINLLGEREALTANSETYKAKIIDFLKKEGYHFVANSSVEGCLADLIFIEPEARWKREIWVEAKYEELSLQEKEFLSELGKYYVSYLSMSNENKFRLYIFIKRCRNLRAWKDIFDLMTEKIEEIEKLFGRIIESTEGNLTRKIGKSGIETFLDFIRDMRVYQGNYESLYLKTAQIEQQKEKLYGSPILEEISQLKDKKETLVGNMLPIKKFPEWLWTTHGVQLGWQEELELHWRGLCAVRSNIVYSISTPSSYQDISESLGLSDWTKLPWHECLLGEDARIGIVKGLIKEYVISKGKKIGCKFDSKTHSLFFVHKNTRNMIQKKGERQVSRAYWTTHGKLNFVEHRSLELQVRFLGGCFYVILNPWRLFTEDGSTVIRGTRAKELHYDFPPKYEFNNVSRGWLDYWKKALRLEMKGLDEENVFLISDFEKSEIDRTSEQGVKFDDSQLSLDIFDRWEVS